jgi:basic membrane lipoprotein Med (substrate-binding protein (PBP1-ABC) superfamily)
LVVVLLWTLWPSPPPVEQPRVRQYLDYTACLLTGERGVSDAVAAPAWAGLQQASLTTKAQVQYLAVTGEQTVDNATTFVNSLAQAGCDVIFGVGDVAVAAIEKSAPAFTNRHFYTVGGTVTAPNVTPIAATDSTGVTKAVNDAATAAVTGHS